MGSNMFITYIVKRKHVEMGPDWGDALQIHHSSLSNKIILYGPALKRYNNSQDDSLQEVMVQFAREHDSLQDDSLQEVMTQFAR